MRQVPPARARRQHMDRGRSMDPSANRVFISYRRDDAAGYAGRLEEALEKRLGKGSTFRDVLDIAPGSDFAAAIRDRLAGAQSVLVLIGPRWAGGLSAGSRRIDDDADFVRQEVAVALGSGARVLPVLLPGAEMPSESELPVTLKPLARRQALSLSDTHWQADIQRLVDAIGLPGRRRVWPWALGSAVLAAGAVATLCALVLNPREPEDPAAQLLGHWQAEVTYPWRAKVVERFEFKRHAGQITGTASFLAYPRAVEQVRVDGRNLHFETRTQQSMGTETRELTHRYSAELHGQPPDERLVLRMQTQGAFHSTPALEFDARRVTPAVSASSATR